jgi:hypothetical protein
LLKKSGDPDLNEDRQSSSSLAPSDPFDAVDYQRHLLDAEQLHQSIPSLKKGPLGFSIGFDLQRLLHMKVARGHQAIVEMDWPALLIAFFFILTLPWGVADFLGSGRWVDVFLAYPMALLDVCGWILNGGFWALEFVV